MVTVTTEDLSHVEQVEQELASAGREAERAAIHKALTLLRRAAVEQLERAAGVDANLKGKLPPSDEPPLRTLTDDQQRRLGVLQEATARGCLSPAEHGEFQQLLNIAEEGAMRNALALIREYAPESDQYVGALRAYKRSFARHRPRSGASQKSSIASSPSSDG
jgi:hypothetical protein